MQASKLWVAIDKNENGATRKEQTRVMSYQEAFSLLPYPRGVLPALSCRWVAWTPKAAWAKNVPTSGGKGGGVEGGRMGGWGGAGTLSRGERRSTDHLRWGKQRPAPDWASPS